MLLIEFENVSAAFLNLVIQISNECEYESLQASLVRPQEEVQCQEKEI